MADLSHAQRTVLRFLDGNPATMPRVVLMSTGLQPTTLRAALGGLMSLGFVVERSGGSIEISDAGRSAIERGEHA